MLRLAMLGLVIAGFAHAWQGPAAATIADSGSTNGAGFTIVVNRSGAAEVKVQPRRFDAAQTASEPTHRVLPKDLVEKFFAQLKAAEPLDSLPAAHCAKSASFGSTLTVSIGNVQSPDLSCGDGGNAVLRDLIGVVRQIVALADVQDMRPKRQVR